MANKKLLDVLENLEDELIKIYEGFHKYPELSNEEFETTKIIKQLLGNVGIEVIDLPLKTGVVAVVRGNPNGPVVAIRCDIDALPISEETHLPYKSKIEGKMHACGHDFHTTVILGAAYLVKKYQKSLIGTVKFIFQPAEESGEGALNILKTGVLDDVDAIFGVHSVSDLEVGEIGIREGAMTAAVDRFEVNITGTGSHAAKPEKSVDPIIVVSNLISAFQSIISRNVSPQEEALLSVTHIESGNTWNVIPESAYMEGTVRTLNEDIRNLIEQRMKEITDGFSLSYGAKTELIWHRGSPATNNSLQWTEFCKSIAKRIDYKVKRRSMGLEGEDFAYYQRNIAGAFIVIGTGASYAHHHPKYKINESAILKCAKYFSLLSECALKEIVDSNYKK